MKHLLSILLISTLFAGELEVDGDLNVTGNIQSQTIDSLLQVIADLQSQIALLQHADNMMETRIFNLENYSIGSAWTCEETFNLTSLTGYELERAIVRVIDFSADCCSGEPGFGPYINVYMEQGMENGNSIGNYDYNLFQPNGGGGIVILTSSTHDICIMGINSQINLPVNANITFAITAQFPSDSDVQLRKPGLQSKDKETVK